jgi:hypothetical protein
MQRALRILKYWLPLAVVAVALGGLVYLAVQQVYRHLANDPQVQMAEDTANAFAQGGSLQTLLPAQNVDIARSLAPFMMLFDKNGEVLAASGQLHGQALPIPAGVLDAAKASGENRVTLQPEPGVRIAAVIVPAGDAGFVLAGRSLRESENRTDQALTIVAAALVVTLIASLAAVIFFEFVVKA